LEYDFVIAPGGSPKDIQFTVGPGPIDMPMVNSDGDLVVGGQTLLRRPVIRQEVLGVQQQIDGHYKIGRDGHVGFDVGSYDTSRPLVIDPVLVYSTFLGGKDIDSASGVAVDSAGNVYVAGTTNSTNFPTVKPQQSTLHGSNDMFVSKISADGSTLLYSTYIGGLDDDEVRDHCR